jgi:hypothetical protein
VSKSIGVAVFVSTLIVAGTVAAQGMLVDFAADRVIKKYQTTTCEQLRANTSKPKSRMEKRAINFLRKHSEARVAFINKIAAPVLNKMFECGLVP